MNFVKKHLVFIVLIAVASAVVVASAVNLTSSAARFRAEKARLLGAMNRWRQLHEREAYPSQENVLRESQNVEMLLQAYSALSDALKRGQVEEEKMEAPDFMSLLENTLRRMRGRMENARVIIAQDFAFGFDKYAGGQMPVPADIPRLVQQLRIVERLCDILADSGITDLVSISREVFESVETVPRAARSGRRGESVETLPVQPEADKDRLAYSTQSFTINARAREHAVFEVLNRLARDPMFNVVTSVGMISGDQDIKTRTVSRPVATRLPDAAGTSFETSTREQRIVVGKEELELSLVLDVYHFMSLAPAPLK